MRKDGRKTALFLLANPEGDLRFVALPLVDAGDAIATTNPELTSLPPGSSFEEFFEEFFRKQRQRQDAVPPAAPAPSAPVASVVPPVVPAAPAPPCVSGGATVASLFSRPACPLSAAEERTLKPKDVFKECDKCSEMVVVPAGSFTMGSPKSEEDRADNEGPQHSVTIAKPFAVGRFAVTFDEWGACVADGGCNGYKPDDKGWGRGRQPVINVSWDDAKAYVAWLSRKTGKPYRLLSEAEREYMARAGTTTPFWWGASISTSQANYGGGSKGEYRAKTVPVDSFLPNAWGLYQVHGNVLDWVEDCYHDSYAGAPTDGSAWVSGDCSRRILRGGSWSELPQFLRAACRIRGTAVDRNIYRGFRLARTLTQ
jgi:formylglycine-generating enzyme required for sulfatase activity